MHRRSGIPVGLLLTISPLAGRFSTLVSVAAGTPDTTATDTVVRDNTSTGNGDAGIILRGNAPGDVVTHTRVVGNTVSGNQPSGIIVAAGEGATLGWTDVIASQISCEFMGVGHVGDVHTAIAANTMRRVTIPVGVGHSRNAGRVLVGIPGWQSRQRGGELWCGVGSTGRISRSRSCC